MRNAWPLSLFLLSAFNAAGAWACEARLPASLAPAQLTMDPFSPDPVQFLDLPLMLQFSEDCSVELTVQSASGAAPTLRSAAGAIAYHVLSPSGAPIRSAMEPGGGVRVSGSGPTQVLLRARFEPYAVLAPSIYADDLELRLFDVNSGALLSGPLSVPLRAQVTPQAQANLAGLTRSAEAAIATMDFGVLETGESQRIYLQVRANTTVAVELASENQGVLKLDGAPDAAPIVYNLTFDGERGAGSSWRTSRTPPLTLSGASYPIDVQIGAVEGRFAGRYRDTVTITVVPN